MRRCCLFLCILFAASGLLAQPVNLAAIPDSLKKGAAVIVHTETIHLEVADLDEAKLKVQRLFTVVNEEGKGALFFYMHSTRFVSLDEAEIRVFDAAGKQISKHKKKEMTTTAVGEGLIEDGYVTFFRVPATAYPVTVEVVYEQKFKGTLFLPDYRFIHPQEAVVQSAYTAKLPLGMKLRYKARNCSIEPVVSDDGKNTWYKWAVSNLPVIDNEAGSVAAAYRFPSVSIVSDQFSHYGFKGDLSSWKSLGAWIQGLYTGLDVLSPERQQFFQQLVSGASDEKEKVRRIYRYLQENFRYVSIQLGIGGWKPFAASFTDQKKYGDCKGLSNYMKAALNAVGIRSHIAIINAGYDEEPADAAFPANDFNHAILCVPGRDSIWLECTSQTAEFNRLGPSTENRNALLVTENGGVLVPTPRSEAGTNTITSRTMVQVREDFSALTETRIKSRGNYAEMMASIDKSKRDEQKQILVFYLGYRQPDDFTITAKEDEDGHQTEMKMAVRKLHEFNAGNKYFLSPRLQKIWAGKLPAAENRKLDYYFSHPFIRIDTTVLTFAGNVTPDVLPTEKKLETAYGSYNAKSWFDEKEKAFYTATMLVLKQHKIPASDYKKVKAFFDEVTQDDMQKIVVRKGEGGVEEKKGF